MAFMEAYKKLDNLCKDLFTSDVGITEYISCMEQCSRGALYADNWQNDYFALKHYRYIRNKIAHENDATEEALCTDTDVLWINGFYQRIINQTDPLTLYRKAANLGKKSKNPAGTRQNWTAAVYQSNSANARRNNLSNSTKYYPPKRKRISKKSGSNFAALIAAAIVIVIIVAVICLLLNFGLPGR